MRSAFLILVCFFFVPAIHAEEVPSATPAPTPRFQFEATLAVAVPQPLTIGIQAHRNDSPELEAFYEAGFFKYPITNSSRSFSDYSIAAGVRYHPFHNWFYTAGEVGFRHIGVSVDLSNLKQDGVALASSADLSLGTFFFGALIGGEWKLSDRLSYAFDLGFQFALLHTGSIQIHPAPGQTDTLDLSVDDAKEMARISGLPVPQVALMRFIWAI